MHFEVSQKTKDLQQQLTAFMDEHIYPNEQRFYDEIERARWSPTRIIEELKPKARAAGLWNLFLPHDEHGAGTVLLVYLPQQRVALGLRPEVFRSVQAGHLQQVVQLVVHGRAVELVQAIHAIGVEGQQRRGEVVGGA